MTTEESASTVIGLFPNQAEAEQAVNRLVESGFSGQDIGFLGPGEAQQPEHGKGGGRGRGRRSVGPIVTAGVWLPPLIGVATGAATGGTVGGLVSLAGSGDEG